MKMKKVMKVVVAVLVALTLVMAFSQVAMAETELDAEKFTNKTASANATGSVYNIIGQIIDIARVIGFGVAIIMLIVLGIQYIAASPEGKAEIKKKSTVYIVGVVILFAAVAILTLIKSFADQI